MNPDRPVEQRSSPRLPAPSTVWLQCRRARDASAELANGLLDLSDRGLQFLSRELLAVGEIVTITLAGSIHRRGEVRWIVELGEGACCCRARFDKPLGDDDVRALMPAEETLRATEAFIFDSD